MHVVQLWQHPVKSMQGGRVTSGRLGERGLDGDRRWAVVDVADGRALSAKWEPALLSASARTDGDGVVVTLPDGTELPSGTTATDAALSDWLGRPVRLERADPSIRRTWRMHEDPLDDRSPERELRCPPGSFVDAAAAHLLTTAALAAAADLYPGGDWDVRRFRPTVVVDAPGAAFLEDGWVGCQVRVGAAAVRVTKTTDRCSMAVKPQPDLRGDADIVRTLTRHHDRRLGVYAAVVEEGDVAEGDAVAVEVRNRPT